MRGEYTPVRNGRQGNYGLNYTIPLTPSPALKLVENQPIHNTVYCVFKAPSARKRGLACVIGVIHQIRWVNIRSAPDLHLFWPAHI